MGTGGELGRHRVMGSHRVMGGHRSAACWILAVVVGAGLCLTGVAVASGMVVQQTPTTDMMEQSSMPLQQELAESYQQDGQQGGFDQGSSGGSDQGSSGGSDAAATQNSNNGSGSTYGGQPYRASEAWLLETAQATGIPVRALAGYASAQLRAAAEMPQCGVGWNTLAAIGAMESGHGTHGGSQIGADGRTTTPIYGPLLTAGSGFAAISDTDGGSIDGSAAGDRAIGPMQFIPSTWEKWGSDNSGDGVADVNQIDDAAWSAARYLCNGGSVSGADQWRAAVYSYNHSDEYVNQIAALANQYAAAVK